MGAGVSAIDGLGLNPEAELGIFVELKQKYEAHDVKTKAEKAALFDELFEDYKAKAQQQLLMAKGSSES
ncbi:hypothetical protein TrCOL_g846 [Triparma columacea]|uniref:Uncharacterized protein n=1 Tax=Triparma columacea TaxID=722753 RepID=A0A9W7G3C1_9STRA|nr:hypothetical protein TrCOL_g846 [Triparma columacea]